MGHWMAGPSLSCEANASLKLLGLSGNSSIRPIAPKRHIFKASLSRHLLRTYYVPGTCYTQMMEK